jgi:hypothetical protein
MVPRRMHGPKKRGSNQRLKKLRKEQFRELHYLSNIVRAIKLNRMWHAWSRKNNLSGVIGKPEGKRPLGRTRHWWNDNIKRTLEIYDKKR